MTRAQQPGTFTVALDHQRGRFFLWFPVLLGIGVGTYFALPHEPQDWAKFGGAGVSLCILGAALWFRWSVTLVCLGGLATILLGLSVAGLRTEAVRAPVLDYRYYGPVEGTLIKVDRSLSDRTRLTLTDVNLSRMAPERTPNRVRVSVQGDEFSDVPPIGARVMLTANLSPPQGPAEPGGFDFRRHAWFLGLGAVGYTRTPVLTVSPPKPHDPATAVARLRATLSHGLQDHLPGEVGGFAAAVLTGDRSGMDRSTIDSLRASNLAHLLAISGLHMGLLTGFVFLFVRTGLSLIPRVALRYSTKKWAAVSALAAGAFYLLLSGGAVATERAFVMASTFLVAVLMDRRAITLRAVALAAVIVLILRPETLTSPGFQMSFAATFALVVGFSAIRDWQYANVPRWMLPAIGLVVSSAIAGAATAPFGAAHFNQIAHYGLIANILSVPVMSLVVIPAAVVAAVLWPVGLHGLGLWVMGKGIAWIIGVASRIADWDNALSFVHTPPGFVLPVLTIGVLYSVLWVGRMRIAGLGLVAAAFLGWSTAERPEILVSQSGGQIGLFTDKTRAISRAKGDGFAVRSWLENDGDPVARLAAFEREGFSGPTHLRTARVGDIIVVHATGKKGAAEISAACTYADLVVTNKPAKVDGCWILDAGTLAKLGSVSVDPATGKVLRSAQAVAGNRPWTQNRWANAGQ